MSILTNHILMKLEMALKKKANQPTKDELISNAEILIDKLNSERKALIEENEELKCLCYNLQRKLRRIELGV